MYFLSQNAVRYLDPVYDPLFLATRPTGTTPTTYFSTYYINPMICADQYVLCNPTTSACTAPVGLVAANTAVGLNMLGFNDVQIATALRILRSFGESGTFSSVQLLGTGGMHY